MRIGKLVLPLLLLASACTTVKVGREFDLAAFDSKVQRGVVRGYNWSGERG